MEIGEVDASPLEARQMKKESDQVGCMRRIICKSFFVLSICL